MNDPMTFVPILSENIEFNKLSEKEYILSNVQHRHYVKINLDVYQLLQLIDGEKNMSELSALLKKQYNKDLSPKFLYELINNKLAPFGVLKGFDYQIKKYEKPDYLKLSFLIINEKMLSKIVRYFYFLFKKKYAICIVSFAIIFISIIFITRIDLYKSFNVNSYFVFYIIAMALSVTFHEIGHATAASYFGAKPGGIGGGFYLFRPVYYADVTDVWRLKKKQRIIVNLSGIYFELIFCSLLLIISLITNNYILLVIALVISLTTLFNLNPFMRSDGFWIVSDLIDKPNLFQHATKKMKSILKWIFFRKPLQWHIYDLVLILYGMVSCLFMGFFIYMVLIKNPASIIYFPRSIINFIQSLIGGADFSLRQLMQLIMPLFFYILLFNMIKKGIKKIIKKH